MYCKLLIFFFKYYKAIELCINIFIHVYAYFVILPRLMFLVLVMCITVHNMMWMSPDGILCDAAFTCLCTVSILYAMKEETTLINKPLQTPCTWFQSVSFYKSYLEYTN